MMKTLIVALSLLLIHTALWAWGERGHHLIGVTAARILPSITSNTPDGRTLASFYSDNAYLYGHLANVPDTVWKSPDTPRIKTMNFYTHFFDAEHFVGNPGKDLASFLEKIRALPTDYATLKQKITHSALSDPPPSQPFVLYHSGTAPWRIQQLYTLLVSAFRCAKSKSGHSDSKKPPLANPFQLPPDRTGEKSDPPIPSYVCQKKSSRATDIRAALILSGVLSHFVGDLTQPLHVTVDYDGWMTGHGGIHKYFETEVVNALDESLNDAITRNAKNLKFQTRVWQRLKNHDFNKKNGIVALSYDLIADSYLHLATIQKIDAEIATIRKGKQRQGNRQKATRRPPSTPKIVAKFRPLIIDRLSVAVVVLAKLWYTAWVAGGTPNMATDTSPVYPYPLAPAFIWPDFDPEMLRASKSSTPL